MKFKTILPLFGLVSVAAFIIAAAGPAGMTAQRLADERADMQTVGRVINIQDATPVEAEIIDGLYSVACRIKWVGAYDADPSVTVAAAGDISFIDAADAADASVLDTGGTPGTIDVSDSLADTWGEVCDIINNEADGNWQCILVDALPSDSSNNTGAILAEKTVAASDLELEDGIPIFLDPVISLDGTNYILSVSIGPESYHRDRFPYPPGQSLFQRTANAFGYADNTFQAPAWRCALDRAVWRSTNSSPGTLYVEVWAVDATETNVTSAATTLASARYKEKLLYREWVETTMVTAVPYVISTGNTPTLVATDVSIEKFVGLPEPIMAPPGHRLIVRFVSSAVLTGLTEANVLGRVWTEGSASTSL